MTDNTLLAEKERQISRLNTKLDNLALAYEESVRRRRALQARVEELERRAARTAGLFCTDRPEAFLQGFADLVDQFFWQIDEED